MSLYGASNHLATSSATVAGQMTAAASAAEVWLRFKSISLSGSGSGSGAVHTSQFGPAHDDSHRLHSHPLAAAVGAACPGAHRAGTSAAAHSRQRPSRRTAGHAHVGVKLVQSISSDPSKLPSPQLRSPLHCAAAGTQCPCQPVAAPDVICPHRYTPPPAVPGSSFQPA